MKKNWTDKELDFIKSHYMIMTYRDIADKLGVKKKAIEYKIGKLGLSKGSGWHGHGNSKYTINQDYFKTWTSTSAYIIGFIVADGHIATNGRNRLVIGINERDLYILELVREKLCKEASIRYYKPQNSVNLAISGKLLIESLSDIGLDTKKSGVSNLFNIIPKRFHRDFIRGFFDGDGCMSYSQRTRGKYKSVEGSVSFVNMDLELLENIKDMLGHGRIKKVKSYYVLRFQRTSEITDFYKYIYSNRTDFLLRKKNKFEEYFKLKEKVNK